MFMHYVMIVIDFLTRTGPGVLIVLIFADILSGLLKSAQQGRWSSDVSYAGMTRKMAILLMLGVAFVLERYSGVPLVASVCTFYAISEGMSLIENLTTLNVPIPPVITQFFSNAGRDREIDQGRHASKHLIDDAVSAVTRRDDT